MRHGGACNRSARATLRLYRSPRGNMVDILPRTPSNVAKQTLLGLLCSFDMHGSDGMSEMSRKIGNLRMTEVKVSKMQSILDKVDIVLCFACFCFLSNLIDQDRPE